MNHNIPLQRYAGSVFASGVYGAPSVRLTRRSIVFLALAGILLALVWANGFDLTSVGLFAAGPVTLSQASQNAASAIDRGVIDEFRKQSIVLDRVPIRPSVNPDGGGSTLVYGYRRVTTQRAAAFRAINAEYSATSAATTEYTVNLRPLGGAFEIDRVLSYIGPAARNEVTFQLEQLVKASRAFAHDQLINGDTAVVSDGFDGLSKALTGTTTEVTATQDWTAITTQVLALQAIKEINAWLGKLDGPPDMLLMNGDALSYFELIAGLSGQLRSAQDAFGRPVATFRDIPLVDMKEKSGSNDPVIATAVDGTTDIYAVRFGEDGFHLASVIGPLVRTWLPDFSTAGAVKKGEAELGPVAPVLKASKAAGVLRGVQVAAAS